MQTMHIAKRLQIRQGGDLSTDRHQILINGFGGIHRKPHIIHRLRRPIQTGVLPSLQVLIILRIQHGLAGKCCTQTQHTRRIQRQQFPIGCHRITISILPNPKLTKVRIAGINLAIVVAIQLRQRSKPVIRQLAIRQPGLTAEQLATVIDLAVAVAIPNQQTVVLPDPASGFRKTIAVVIEVDASGFVDGVDAIAV